MATKVKPTKYKYTKVTLSTSYTLYGDDSNAAVAQALQKLIGDVRAGRANLNFKTEIVTR